MSIPIVSKTRRLHIDDPYEIYYFETESFHNWHIRHNGRKYGWVAQRKDEPYGHIINVLYNRLYNEDYVRVPMSSISHETHLVIQKHLRLT